MLFLLRSSQVKFSLWHMYASIRNRPTFEDLHGLHTLHNFIGSLECRAKLAVWLVVGGQTEFYCKFVQTPGNLTRKSQNHSGAIPVPRKPTTCQNLPDFNFAVF